MSPTDTERFLKDHKSKYDTLIYKFSKFIMGQTISFASKATFLVPIFSGTLALEDLGLFPATLYKIESIPVPRLDVNNSVTLVETELKSRNVNPLLLKSGNLIIRATKQIFLV